MPLSVEAVFPVGAGGVIGKIVVLVVDTFEFVRTWFTLFCFKPGRVGFFIGLAAPGHISVVFQFVGAATFLAFRSMGTAGKCCMALFPTVIALGDPWVHGSASYGSNVFSKVEGPIDDGFGFGAILGVPDVDPYNGHVRVL